MLPPLSATGHRWLMRQGSNLEPPGPEPGVFAISTTHHQGVFFSDLLRALYTLEYSRAAFLHMSHLQ